MARLPDPASVAWIRRGDGLAGWGEVARVSLPAGEDRFTAGEKWLTELFDGAEVTDRVGLPGCGPVAFGSFTFDPTSDGSVLIVPRGRARPRRGPLLADHHRPPGRHPGPRPPPAPGPGRARPDELRWHDGSLTAPQWQRAVRGGRGPDPGR